MQLAALNLPNKHADPDQSVIKHIINMEKALSLGLAKISSTSYLSKSEVGVSFLLPGLSNLSYIRIV